MDSGRAGCEPRRRFARRRLLRSHRGVFTAHVVRSKTGRERIEPRALRSAPLSDSIPPAVALWFTTLTQRAGREGVEPPRSSATKGLHARSGVESRRSTPRPTGCRFAETANDDTRTLTARTEKGAELSLRQRTDDTLASTVNAHRLRLKHFLRWCEQESVTGRRGTVSTAMAKSGPAISDTRLQIVKP